MVYDDSNPYSLPDFYLLFYAFPSTRESRGKVVTFTSPDEREMKSILHLQTWNSYPSLYLDCCPSRSLLDVPLVFPGTSEGSEPEVGHRSPGETLLTRRVDVVGVFYERPTGSSFLDRTVE